MTEYSEERPNAPELESGDDLPSTRNIKVGVTIFMILLVIGSMLGATFLKGIVKPADDAAPAEAVEASGDTR